MLNPVNRILHPPAAIVLACSAALLPFAQGCANSASTASTSTPVTSTPVTPTPVTPTPVTPSTVTDVYVAGVDYINGVSIATVWKNGVETQIGAPGLASYAVGIVRVGSDIYVAGGQNDGVTLKPVLWKNGVASMLPALGGYGEATGITASGSDVYVCGYSQSTDGKTEQSNIWKNGVASIVQVDVPNAVAISGSDAYVAGTSIFFDGPQHSGYTIATVVKNFFPMLLDQITNYNNSAGEAIAVQGTDVYVGGSLQTTSTGVISATVWKNGVPTQLSTDSGYVYSVFVNGADVYASGEHGSKQVSSGDPGGAATVWKNGVATDYSVDAAESIVLQVAVSGSALYAVGFTDKGAYLWKNGIPTVLPSASPKAVAQGIAFDTH